MGSIILGQGFTLTPEERSRFLTSSKANSERIFPYLGGSEVNSSPKQDFERYVISFGDMPLEEAERWPDLIKIVRKKVVQQEVVRGDGDRITGVVILNTLVELHRDTDMPE